MINICDLSTKHYMYTILIIFHYTIALIQGCQKDFYKPTVGDSPCQKCTLGKRT